MSNPSADLYSMPEFVAWKQGPGKDFSWIDDQTGRTARAFWGWMDSGNQESSPSDNSTQTQVAPDKTQNDSLDNSAGLSNTSTPTSAPTTPTKPATPTAPNASSGSGYGSGSVGGVPSSGGGGSSGGWLSELLNRSYVNGGSAGGMSGGGGGGGSTSNGGLGMTSGQIVSVKSNETKPNVDYSKLIESLTKGSASSTAAYNKSADSSMKNLNQMFEKILGLTSGSRDTEIANAQEKATQDSAKTQMNMSMTGLGNSTVLPSLLAQQQKYSDQNISGIKQSANQDMANVLSQQIAGQNQLLSEKRNTNLNQTPTQTQLLQMMLPLITGSSSGGNVNLQSLLSMLG
jgi:hypothetical protein